MSWEVQYYFDIALFCGRINNVISMKVKVEKIDDFGRGISYIDDKITFIHKTVPGDIVDVSIVIDKKKYNVAKVNEIVEKSKNRIDSICPFYLECGGCSMQNLEYRIELEYKLDKINNLLRKNKIDYQVNKIIKSKKRFNYRNKISLKIENGQVGYYEELTHNLIEINNCDLVCKTINDIIKDINNLEIKSGTMIIRSNSKNELLLIIDTDSYNKNGLKLLIDRYKIAGIILNKKCIHGVDFFVDKIGDYLFKISYNSFFQVNRYTCSELFDLVNEYTKDSKNVIDLYCGVGTLGIVAKNNCEHVLGVEIVDNAIYNAKTNSIMNNVTNIDFVCSDTNKIVDFIKDSDFVIVDPPRSGLTDKVIDGIKKYKVDKILYVSCDPNTLVRDLKSLLEDYDITDYKLLDMFPGTYHVESICILERK